MKVSKPLQYRIYQGHLWIRFGKLGEWKQLKKVNGSKFLPINQRFGKNDTPFYAQLGLEGHNGIDWLCPTGSTLYAPVEGQVINVRTGYPEGQTYDNNIVILTPPENDVRYAVILGHLSEVFVKKDDMVKRGDIIGLTGNCFDKETEILTDKGWKYFKDLDGTELVATLNINKNELEFQKPLKYTAKFEEYMNLCNFGKANFCVSDDHNMLVYYGRKQDKLKLIEYNKLPNKHRIKFKHTTNWIGKEEQYYNISGGYKKRGFLKDKYFPDIKIDMDLWLEFLGILIADGSVDYKRNRITIDQSTSYKDNIEKIQSIFDRLPFHYNKQERKRWKKYNSTIIWTIVNQQLVKSLISIGIGKNKKAPEYIKELSSRQIQIFLDSFFMGDGYIRRNNEKYYYPGLSKILADQLQEYLLKIGKCGNISEKIFNVEKNYQVYEHNSDYSWIVKDNCKRILYNDFAYCVSVPNKTLYVRRNGRPIFLGNTGKYTTGSHLHEGFKELKPMQPGLKEFWYSHAWGEMQNGYGGYVDHYSLIDEPQVIEFPYKGFVQNTDTKHGGKGEVYECVDGELIYLSSDKVDKHIPLVDRAIKLMKDGIEPNSIRAVTQADMEYFKYLIRKK